MQIKMKILSFSLLTVILFSCQKSIKEESISSTNVGVNQTTLQTLSTLAASDSFDAGAVHNAMLNDYYQNISTDPTFFNDFDTSNYKTLFDSKLKVITQTYAASGNYEARLIAAGVTNASQVIQDLIDSSTYFVENYPSILAGTSPLFQDRIAHLTHLVNTFSSFPEFESLVVIARNKYSGKMPTATENQALDYAYSIAIASNQYWDQNQPTWDAAFPGSGTMQFTVTTVDPGDIILADMVGGIVGTVRGAVRGMAAGPGGATIGGIIGVVTGAAKSSGAAYGWGRIKSWLFD